jgi:pimeloyl-ACP methyl ester carboxylesterase
VDKQGRPEDKSKWSFSVIEHLFDAVKRATGSKMAQYYLYGHSEGGQFVQRLVLFLPEARYARAVAANPGWYTTPDFDVKFPYGLKNAPVTKESLEASLGRNFILMLGDQDTDPNHEQLRKTTEAMAQGATRVERGQNYIKLARACAAELKCRCAWRLRMVPGAAHQNSKMSRAAAPVLLGD